MKEDFDLIVVGAGAAGLFAAGLAAERGKRVLILEKMKIAGRKLSITGKGRCNLTHEGDVNDFVDVVQPDGRFLRSALSDFYTGELIEKLEEIGIATTLERGGRYFPSSNSAPDVRDKLVNWCKRLKVRIFTEFTVTKIVRTSEAVNGVQGLSNNKGVQKKESFLGNNVLIATGGLSYPATGSDGDGYTFLKSMGHTITTCMPSLVPLEVDQKILKALAGLEIKNAKATLVRENKKVSDEFGDLTFLNNGISGPIIITLSRLAVPILKETNHVALVIDFKPALDEDKLDKRLVRDFTSRAVEPLDSILRGLMPKKMIPLCLEHSKLNGSQIGAEISAKSRRRILRFLKGFELQVTGHRPYSEAIITKGGASCKEFNQKSMESKYIKGLYVAGELLDLDGPTGGYNLQIAFTTAHAVAKSI